MINLDRMMLMRKAQHVLRFHTVPTLHRQNVGEHTFGVLSILLEVWPSAGTELIKAALYHDAPEAVVGDTPSPALREFGILKDGVGIAESVVRNKYGLHTTLTVQDEKVLRFCDIMECMIFCLEEWYRGNKTALIMAERAEEYIRSAGLHKISTEAETLFTMYTVKLIRGSESEGESDARE